MPPRAIAWLRGGVPISYGASKPTLGVKMTQIGFLEFWEFMWRERGDLWRFLKWTGEMERYVHPKPKVLARNRAVRAQF